MILLAYTGDVKSGPFPGVDSATKDQHWFAEADVFKGNGKDTMLKNSSIFAPNFPTLSSQ